MSSFQYNGYHSRHYSDDRSDNGYRADLRTLYADSLYRSLCRNRMSRTQAHSCCSCPFRHTCHLILLGLFCSHRSSSRNRQVVSRRCHSDYCRNDLAPDRSNRRRPMAPDPSRTQHSQHTRNLQHLGMDCNPQRCILNCRSVKRLGCIEMQIWTSI